MIVATPCRFANGNPALARDWQGHKKTRPQGPGFQIAVLQWLIFDRDAGDVLVLEELAGAFRAALAQAVEARAVTAGGLPSSTDTNVPAIGDEALNCPVPRALPKMMLAGCGHVMLGVA